MNDIRRRVSEQENSDKGDKVTRKPKELHQCFCYNNDKLSWDETFDSLLEFQNSNSAQAPLSTSELYKAATLICENIVVISAEFEFKLKSDSIDKVLRLMPVMLLKSECGDIFINLHEFILTQVPLRSFYCVVMIQILLV